MKKILFMSFVVFALVAGASVSQASYVELDLPDSLPYGAAGSIDIGVYLTDLGSLSNVDTFNLYLIVSGVSGLEMPWINVEGPTKPGYIFSGNSFAFTATNPNGDLTQLAVMDAAKNKVGADLSSGKLLLAWFTLNYPALKEVDVISFSLNPAESFAISDATSGSLDEGFILTGRTQIPNVPIPGAIWLLGSGIMSLVGLRRWSHRP